MTTSLTEPAPAAKSAIATSIRGRKPGEAGTHRAGRGAGARRPRGARRAMRAWLEPREMGPRASMATRSDDPLTPLANLRQRSPSDRRRGVRRTVRRVPLMVYARLPASALRGRSAAVQPRPHASAAQRSMLIRDLLDKMRHEGCGKDWRGRRSCSSSAIEGASAAARTGASDPAAGGAGADLHAGQAGARHARDALATRAL